MKRESAIQRGEIEPLFVYFIGAVKWKTWNNVKNGQNRKYFWNLGKKKN